MQGQHECKHPGTVNNQGFWEAGFVISPGRGAPSNDGRIWLVGLNNSGDWEGTDPTIQK